MLTFPLSITLIPYAIAVIFFAIMAVVNVYHLVHYGATTGVSFVVTFLFLAGASFILFFTWQGVAGTDWDQEVRLAPFAAGISFDSL